MLVKTIYPNAHAPILTNLLQPFPFNPPLPRINPLLLLPRFNPHILSLHRKEPARLHRKF